MHDFKFTMFVGGIVALGWLTSDITITAAALFGAGLGIAYNFDFIRANRRVGVTIAIGSFVLPILATFAIMSIFNLRDFSLGNLIGLLGGMLGFEFVRTIMFSQSELVKRIFNLIFRKGGESQNNGNR